MRPKQDGNSVSCGSTFEFRRPADGPIVTRFQLITHIDRHMPLRGQAGSGGTAIMRPPTAPAISIRDWVQFRTVRFRQIDGVDAKRPVRT